MKKPRKTTAKRKEAMLLAMEANLCIISKASKECGIDRTTHYRWLREDDDYKRAISYLEESVIDFVESQLYRQIKEGNTAATIFFMKTKAKSRGYVEKQQVEVQQQKEQIFKIGNTEIRF